MHHHIVVVDALRDKRAAIHISLHHLSLFVLWIRPLESSSALMCNVLQTLSILDRVAVPIPLVRNELIVELGTSQTREKANIDPYFSIIKFLRADSILIIPPPFDNSI